MSKIRMKNWVSCSCSWISYISY